MVWLIGYLVVALVAWPFAARLVYAEFFGIGPEGDVEDKALAILMGGGLAGVWPLSLTAVAVYKAAFGERKGGRGAGE